MLTVIFGAGASFDSDPSYPPGQSRDESIRLPLANQLFADRPIFSQALRQFPECHEIIPYLRTRRDNMSVEQVLENLQGEAQHHPVRHKQLAAVRYYLQLMLRNCEHSWTNVTGNITSNYRTLLDQIEQWRPGYQQVCLVTFNYDTLLDTAFQQVGIKITTMSDYVSEKNYKLIKVHGSLNWAREVLSPIDNLATRNSGNVVHELINRAASLGISDNYHIITDCPVGLLPAQNPIPILPALAIPVQKKHAFECPPDHLEQLRGCLSQTTKLLVIGWQGVESHFVELLRTIPSGTPGLVVAGGKANAQEVVDRLGRDVMGVNWTSADGGFTDFVVKRTADKFLRYTDLR